MSVVLAFNILQSPVLTSLKESSSRKVLRALAAFFLRVLVALRILVNFERTISRKSHR
jgi:hypothetical protein